MEIKKVNIPMFVATMIIISLSALALLFGIVAPRLFIGLMLLYIIPFYLILGKFNLESLEKFMLSLFTSLGVIPISAYYLSKVVGSLRTSLVIILVLLYVLAVSLNKDKLIFFGEKCLGKKSKKNEKQDNSKNNSSTSLVIEKAGEDNNTSDNSQ